MPVHPARGSRRVPRSYTEGDFGLGPWVNKQRAAFKNGKLDSDRVARLEALPGWSWDARPTPASSIETQPRSGVLRRDGG
jgi:hypothetical protein